MRTKRQKWPLVVLGVMALLMLVGAAYFSDYYRADATALGALESGGGVTVEETEYGWRFDGPSTTTALVFYPGAKVEASAYAPLLHLLAQEHPGTLLKSLRALCGKVMHPTALVAFPFHLGMALEIVSQTLGHILALRHDAHARVDMPHNLLHK